MKRFLFLFFITSLHSIGQTNLIDIKKSNQDSIKSLLKSIEFIKQVKGKELQDSNFILVDKPFELNSFYCLSQLLSDSSTFSKAELSFIQQKYYPSIIRWNKSFFSTIKLVSSETIDSIFKNQSAGWNYFYKKFGQSFNHFSIPIFLRNYTYCIFYYDVDCGFECGDGHMYLYKLMNGNWIKIATYCNWIS